MGLCRNKRLPDLREQPCFVQEAEKQHRLCGSSPSSAFYFSAKADVGRRLAKIGEGERKAETDKSTEWGMQTKKERRKGKKERDQKKEKQEEGEKERRWGARCLWFPFTPHHGGFGSFCGLCCQAISFSRQEREETCGASCPGRLNRELFYHEVLILPEDSGSAVALRSMHCHQHLLNRTKTIPANSFATPSLPRILAETPARQSERVHRFPNP